MFTERGGDSNIDHSYAFNGHLQYENDLKRLNWAPGDRKYIESLKSTGVLPLQRMECKIIGNARDGLRETIPNRGAKAH